MLQCHKLFQAIQEELESRDTDLKDGLSFLDLKNDTLLSYMIDVCNIVLHKVRGERIEGNHSVKRCVEYRVTFEKIKAIDQKLAYQLNKLITLPDNAEGGSGGIDVNNLDINVDGLGTDAEDDDDGKSSGGDDDEDDDDDDEEGDADLSPGDDENDDSEANSDIEDTDTDEDDKIVQKRKPPTKELPKKLVKGNNKLGDNKSGIYRPPKLRSVAYTEENDFKRGDKGRRKNYDDFYQDEDPTDIVEESRVKADDERVQFEEDNYTRLPEDNPKKAKRKLKTKEYRKKGKNNKFKRRR